LIFRLLALTLLPPMLPVLDARIKAYHTHLASSNLTTHDRTVLAGQMSRDMFSRYKLLEEVNE